MIHLLYTDEENIEIDDVVAKADCLENIQFPKVVRRIALEDHGSTLVLMHELTNNALCPRCENNFYNSGGRGFKFLIAIR